MFRATKEKIAERERLKSDYELWLEAGNQPTELPGFGMRPAEHGLPRFNDKDKAAASAQARRQASMGGQASGKARKRVEGY